MLAKNFKDLKNHNPTSLKSQLGFHFPGFIYALNLHAFILHSHNPSLDWVFKNLFLLLKYS